VAGQDRPLEILGALVNSLGRRERGWRVRFDTGVEAMLVREPGAPAKFSRSHWYSDEPFDDRVAAPGAGPSPARSDTPHKKTLTGRLR
jgi:hypothetical protein